LGFFSRARALGGCSHYIQQRQQQQKQRMRDETTPPRCIPVPLLVMRCCAGYNNMEGSRNSAGSGGGVHSKKTIAVFSD